MAAAVVFQTAAKAMVSLRLTGVCKCVLLGGCAVVLAGCMSNNTVRPLTPAPTTAVTSTALPQPITIGGPQTPVDGQSLETQTLDQAAGVETADSTLINDVETALASDVAPPANATGDVVEEEELVGVWSASTPSATCSINLSLTNWTGGYRASTRNCGDVQLATLSAWSVEGQQVMLKGSDGAPLARLFRTGGTRYAGQLETGQTVTIFR